MSVLIFLIFVGLVVMVLTAVFFMFTLKNGEYEHIEETSLMPMDEED